MLFSLQPENASNVFPSLQRQRNLNMNATVSGHFGLSRDYRDVIVFKMSAATVSWHFIFQIRPSGLKSVFEKLRFRDRLV